MYVESFKQLIVWQKSMDLVRVVYSATSKMPKEEIFGLVSQMRRCAVSIPSNVAEGKKRKTKNDFLQFLRIADGSVGELETQIIIAKDLFRVDFSMADPLLEEVQKMLAVMIKRVSSL